MSREADKWGWAKGEKGYHKILGWQRAHSLVRLTYQLTEKFPKDERFGLIRQLRNAVVSVPANIVEGYARGTSRQYHYHLNVAWGSLAEVEYYLELALDLKYIDADEYDASEALRRETAYLLRRLMDSIAARQKKEPEGSKGSKGTEEPNEFAGPSSSSAPSVSSVSSAPSVPSEPSLPS